MNGRDSEPSMMNAVEPHDIQSWEDVRIIQDNNKTKESKEHSEQNWKHVGNKIKEISESI